MLTSRIYALLQGLRLVPNVELLAFKGTMFPIMFPLISILVMLISRIYALLQFLLTSPNLKVLLIEGIISPLIEVNTMLEELPLLPLVPLVPLLSVNIILPVISSILYVA